MGTPQNYWHSVPRKATFGFLIGVFLLFSTFGFASDVPSMGAQPLPRFILTIFLSGLFPVFYAAFGFALRRKVWKAIIPIFIIQFFTMGFLKNYFPDRPISASLGPAEISQLEHRLNIDACGIIIAVMFGYGCFLYVTIAESRRYFRVHAEMQLARQIHQVLVPPIQTQLGNFEFYGLSAPSGEVGGDLIDVAGTQEHWVAYMADVSGHGVAPGVVMGMVKSAARMLLSSGESTDRLMPRLNEVLYPLKSSDMFITFCFVAQNAHELRVGLAGHPAILHYSAATNSIVAIECPNMPLGILPENSFSSSQAQSQPGDVFAMYTDGFLETANRSGEEFGVARLTAEIHKHAKEPLQQICAAVQQAITQHGAQFDDQSLLLIRHL